MKDELGKATKALRAVADKHGRDSKEYEQALEHYLDVLEGAMDKHAKGKEAP